MNRRNLLKSIFIFSLIMIMSIIFINYSKNSKHNKIKIVSGHSFEYNKGKTILKEFDGKYLNSFVTIALKRENFIIELEGVDSNSEVFIINPDTGDMIPFDYDGDKFSANTKLDNDITYGIIIDYALTGAIRVVDNFKDLDEDKLFEEILFKLSCGIE